MTKPVEAAAAATPSQRAQFHSAFPQLASAILEEWPQLDAESLAAASADQEKVVELIAEKSGHTKTLVRKQLEEILQIVTAPVDGVRPDRHTMAGFAHDARAAAATVGEAAHDALHSVEAILEKFEKRTRPLLRELRGNVLTDARDKVREHWLLALLGTLGLGFLVGLLFSVRPKGK
jgi:hypothetical protein